MRLPLGTKNTARGSAPNYLNEVEGVLPRIGALPESFPRLLDVSEDSGNPQTLLPRFPYALVFISTDVEIQFNAVAHTTRRPGYWLDRVR